MINTRPLQRLMVERDITADFISQATGIDKTTLNNMSKGKSITPDNLNALCSVLNCQPHEIIEFSKSERSGHWEWIEEKND